MRSPFGLDYHSSLFDTGCEKLSLPETEANNQQRQLVKTLVSDKGQNTALFELTLEQCTETF